MNSYVEDGRWQGFLASLLPEETLFLATLRAECERGGIPIIRRETAYFLRWILVERRPRHILEIGTAVGYSAVFMADFSAEADIITVEKDTGAAERARKHIEAAGVAKRVRVVEADAAEWIMTADGAFDLIFLDGPKAQYVTMLRELLRLLVPGGLLVADNILAGAMTLESRFAVERRDRTIHKRMREFLYEITHDAELVSDILPIGDGLAISVKQGGGK